MNTTLEDTTKYLHFSINCYHLNCKHYHVVKWLHCLMGSMWCQT